MKFVKIPNIKAKYIYIISLVFMITVFICFLYLYDRYLNPHGGIFCKDISNSNISNLVFSNEIVCFGSGVDLKSTSIKYLGNEQMYLIKDQKIIDSICVWINDENFKIVILKDNLIRNITQVDSCSFVSKVYISRR